MHGVGIRAGVTAGAGMLALSGCSAGGPAPGASKVTAADPPASPGAAALSRTPPTAPASEIPLPREFCMPKERLCFNHPAGWSFSVAPPHPGLPTLQTVLLKNARGRTVCTVSSGVDGVAGACMPVRMESNDVLAVEPTQLRGYEETESGHVDRASVSTVLVKLATGFQPYVMLTTDRGFSTVGESRNCGLNSGNTIKGKPDPLRPVMFSMGEGDGPPPYPGKEAAKAALHADVPVLVQVLRSAHYR